MMCVLILYISGGTYSSKSTPKDRFFEKLLMAILFTLRVFARNLLRGNRQTNIFRILFWYLALAFRLVSQHNTLPNTYSRTETIDAVHQLILQDRHVTYRDIETTLGISGISIHSILRKKTSIHSILRKKIRPIRKPHSLSSSSINTSWEWELNK